MNFNFLSDPDYDVLGAFWMNVQLTFWSAIGSLIWGVLLAAMRVSPVPLMRAFGTAYVNVFRNIPLTVIIMTMSVVLSDTLGVPARGARTPQTFLDDKTFRLAVLGFIVYTSTFVCEAIRSGINTVPAGQAEAARAIGLTFTQVLRHHRAAAGDPGGDRAAGQRADRADQEHHGRQLASAWPRRPC